MTKVVVALLIALVIALLVGMMIETDQAKGDPFVEALDWHGIDFFKKALLNYPFDFGDLIDSLPKRYSVLL